MHVIRHYLASVVYLIRLSGGLKTRKTIYKIDFLDTQWTQSLTSFQHQKLGLDLWHILFAYLESDLSKIKEFVDAMFLVVYSIISFLKLMNFLIATCQE